jgi:hypothetical protein
VDDLESQLDADPLSLRDLPLKAAIDGDTVVAGIWWKGGIMTGQDVRSINETSQQTADRPSPTKSSKKKIRKPLKRGGKMVRGQH